MRQLWRKIDSRTKAGEVKLECADAEDMWHLYNILAVEDTVRATTFRKVQSESVTGTRTSKQLKMTLTLQVTKISYDTAGAAMRVLGRNTTPNEFVALGSYHTVELEPHRAFTLGKQFWDAEYLRQLNTALNPHTDADLAAVVMHEGLAHVLLLSHSLTLTRARVETSIPRKGKNALYNRESSLNKFFAAVYNALLTHIDLAAIKAILIASPGFVKDEFYKYMNVESQRTDERKYIDNKSKIVLCHSSSGHRHALQEVLARPELQSRLKQTKAVGEVRALEKFFKMLAEDETRAVYGPTHVLYAASIGAIDVLLVTDVLFRSADISTRQDYVNLVEGCKKGGAKVVVFSDQHVSGAQLKGMSGVAAILRFPLPEIDDIAVPDPESESDDSDIAPLPNEGIE